MMRQFVWRMCVVMLLAGGGLAAFGTGQAPRVEYRPGVLIQLGVTNLNRSVAFYAKLGFAVTERRDDLKFVHLSTNTPGVEIGLSEVAVPDVRGPILNFTVVNAAAARKALESEGVTFVGENVVIPGKVVLATFLDPDGHRLRFAGVPLALAVSADVTPLAEQQPSLAGSWTLDGFMGRAPLGFRDERAICPLPSSGASTGDSAQPRGPSSTADDEKGIEQVTSLGTLEADVTISQTPTEITVERRYSGSAGTGSHKDVFKLDGTESVSTVGKVTSRTKSRWEGAALVVEHHLTWGTAEGSSCHVREQFSLDSGGALSIVATNERQGHSSSRQTYVKKGR